MLLAVDKAAVFMDQLLTDEEIRLVVTRCLDRDDVRVVEMIESPFSDEDVAGVMSEQSRVKIIVEVDGGVSTLSFFTKYLPRRLPHRAEMEVLREFFSREITFYRRIGPLYTTVDACFPRCYLIRNDLLVLEDLAERGFRILDQRHPFDYEHCVVALTTLARFHAATLDLDDVDFASIKFPGNEGELDYQSGAMVQASTALAEMVTATSMDVGTLHEAIDRGLGESLSLIKGVEISAERRVLCHFDLWSNNIMFAYDTDGRPTDARLVDFQQAFLAPPALDISMLLHMTTSASFREQHRESLLNLYRERQGNLISKDNLEALYQKFSRNGSSAAFFYCSTVFAPRQLVAQSLRADTNFVKEKIKIAVELFREDEGFRSRIVDVINCFLEHYYPQKDQVTRL